ncbi:hypothetical protein D9M71_766000 [compost metagenome]
MQRAARPVPLQQAQVTWQGKAIPGAADDQDTLAIQARRVGQGVVHCNQAAHFGNTNPLAAHQPRQQQARRLPLEEQVDGADRRYDRNAEGQALVDGREQRSGVATQGDSRHADVFDAARLQVFDEHAQVMNGMQRRLGE